MRDSNISRRTVIKCLIVTLSVLLIVSVAVGLVYIIDLDDPDEDGKLLDEYLEFDGEKYYLRKGVETLLVIGIDKYDEVSSNEIFTNSNGTVVRNMHCSDFLMLIVFDHANETSSAIHIDRDTMVKIEYSDKDGNKHRTAPQQIALAHSYGSGGEDSCENVVNAVSELLGGIEIKSYAKYTMEAIYKANSAVGGVELTVLDDLPEKGLVKGETVRLSDEQAEYYVRYRLAYKDSSNVSRMQRQVQYLRALYSQLVTKSKDDINFLTGKLAEMQEYMQTNCADSELISFFEIGNEYERGDIHGYKGDIVESPTTGWMELYNYEGEIKKIVIKLFCKQDSDSN